MAGELLNVLDVTIAKTFMVMYRSDIHQNGNYITEFKTFWNLRFNYQFDYYITGTRPQSFVTYNI